MFSIAELRAAKEWAEIGQSMLADQYQSRIFTDLEKRAKCHEHYMLGRFIDTVKEAQKKYVSLDADHWGHLTMVCEEYMNYVREQWETGEMTHQDYANACYGIGYMRARLEFGLLTAEDTTLLQEWEAELE